MRILLVNDCPTGLPGSGGVEKHVRQLYDALLAREHTVTILAAQLRDKPEQRNEYGLCIPHLNAPPLRKQPLANRRNRQQALQKAEAFITEWSPDVIHVHNFMQPDLLEALLRHGRVLKSIHDCRPFCTKPQPAVASRLVGNSSTFCNITFGARCWSRCYLNAGDTLMDRLEAWSYYPANLKAFRTILRFPHLVLYSQYLEDLATASGVRPEQIHRLCLFPDVPDQLPEKEQNETPLILFAGRLAPEKGIRHLFEALQRLPTSLRLQLVIAGDGPYRKDLKHLGNDLPNINIHFMGFLEHDRLLEQYAQADLVVFPSIGSEGCPLTGIEAMYCGTPVVGFNTGGVPEWLVDGQTGLLVPRGDMNALSAAIQHLLTQPELRRQLGTQAQRYVREKFDKNRHIEQLEALYRQVSEGAPA